jgi:hypothetical protein
MSKKVLHTVRTNDSDFTFSDKGFIAEWGRVTVWSANACKKQPFGVAFMLAIILL